MRVSVVIPAYNAEATLADALDSVLAQTRPPDEIIVVDDGSRDGTATLAESYGPRGVKLLRRENGGPGRARNTGITAATGELVALLDADDAWATDKLARQLPLFERHPLLVAAAGAWTWGPGGPFPEDMPVPLFLRGDEWRRPLRATEDSRLRLGFSMVSSTVVASRLALLSQPFDADLPTAEDRDVWIRLAELGDLWFDPLPLVVVACRPDSQSNSDTGRDCRSMLAVLDRYRHGIRAAELREWEARTYGKWAGRLLAAGRPREAIRPAVERLRREWWSPRGWWIMGKCLVLSLGGPRP